MQEKDIREKLNQELEQMAPDILDKILNTPIEPISSEKELFGKERPLFKDKKNWVQYFKVPAIAALAACFVALIILFYPMLGNMDSVNQKVAFSIVVDVNPSLCIDVNKDGSVKKIKAVNKDAKQIVNYVKSEMDEEDDYKAALNLVVKNLKKEGYLKKKNNAMLISAVGTENDDIAEPLKEVKKETHKALNARHIKCKAVYQKIKVNDKIKKIAEKNNVSVGKAALCMKLAKNEKVSVNKMCRKNIDKLVREIKKSNYSIIDSIVIIDTDAELPEEETAYMSETATYETEYTEMTSEAVETENPLETMESPSEPALETGQTPAENNTTYAY